MSEENCTSWDTVAYRHSICSRYSSRYSNAFISALNARVPDSDAYAVNVSGSTEISSSQARNTGGQLRTLTFAKPNASKTMGGNTFLDYESKGGTSDIQLSSMGKRDVVSFSFEFV